MGMLFIPGVGSGGNTNPVGSGWDPGWIGWDDELLFFSKFFKVVEDIPGNIPREYYATAPRWKFRNIFVNCKK